MIMLAAYEFEGQGEIISPQLVYYPQIIRENIALMKQIAGGSERLWPHIKTHKMAPVVKLLLEQGIDKFKCATIAELEMAAGAGAKQLVLAYPLVGPNIRRFVQAVLAYPQVTLYAIGDDDWQIRLLGEQAARNGVTVNVLMDTDLGQHRTGVAISEAVSRYQEWDSFKGIRMCGLHCYDGHRHESDLSVRFAEVEKEDEGVRKLKAAIREAGLACPVVILGGTPSFPCHAKLMDDYLSPGTCVIQDAGYEDSYPDLPFVPGAAILTRVVSHPSPDTFTLDLGTKAVACDPPIPRVRVLGFSDAETVMQNEEHLVLRVPAEKKNHIPAIGTELFAIPVHICPTTALYPSVPVVENGGITGWWRVDARDRKIGL